MDHRRQGLPFLARRFLHGLEREVWDKRPGHGPPDGLPLTELGRGHVMDASNLGEPLPCFTARSEVFFPSMEVYIRTRPRSRQLSRTSRSTKASSPPSVIISTGVAVLTPWGSGASSDRLRPSASSSDPKKGGLHMQKSNLIASCAAHPGGRQRRPTVRLGRHHRPRPTDQCRFCPARRKGSCPGW